MHCAVRSRFVANLLKELEQREVGSNISCLITVWIHSFMYSFTLQLGLKFFFLKAALCFGQGLETSLVGSAKSFRQWNTIIRLYCYIA